MGDLEQRIDAFLGRRLLSLDEWERVGNAIMECATGKPGPLSDSDVGGVINDLGAKVAELQAWKDAVPVDAIAEWWKSPVNWTGYDHAQYDAWYQAVKKWVKFVKPD